MPKMATFPVKVRSNMTLKIPPVVKNILVLVPGDYVEVTMRRFEEDDE